MGILNKIKKVNPIVLGLIIVIVVALIGFFAFNLEIFGTTYTREYFGNSDGKLIMYGAEWCGYCRQFKPEFKQLGKSHKVNGKTIEIIEYDADKHPQKVKEANVDGFPTVHLHINGKKKAFKGDRTITGLKKFLKNNTNLVQD